jgi:acyl-CoA oxidase
VSLIKAWVSLIGRDAARFGRELMGGNGILIDRYVMRALNDMEAVYTYEGTYDTNVLVVGRAITGISAFKSPYKSNNE